MILIKHIKFNILFCLCLLFIGCDSQSQNNKIESNGVSLKILGTVQDGGIPHLGCNKTCCKDYFKKGYSKKHVVSLGISDLKENKNYYIGQTKGYFMTRNRSVDIDTQFEFDLAEFMLKKDY